MTSRRTNGMNTVKKSMDSKEIKHAIERVRQSEVLIIEKDCCIGCHDS